MIDYAPVSACAGHFPELRRREPKPLGVLYVQPVLSLNSLPDDDFEDLVRIGTFGWLEFVRFVRRGERGGGATVECRCVAPTGPLGAQCGKPRLVGAHALRTRQARTCGAMACRVWAKQETERAARP
jgi:hypothetical protein